MTRYKYIKRLTLTLLTCLSLTYASAQSSDQVHWLSFEELADSLQHNPNKRVLISFHTEYCAYCRKMHREVFTKPDIAEFLNQHFYAVEFDAESTDTVRFEGAIFINENATKQRRGIHQIAEILGRRNGQFTVPITLVLDGNFNVHGRYFEYLSPQKMRAALGMIK